MADCRPIDGCDPTLLIRVVMDDPFGGEFIRAALLIGVVHIEGQNHALAQLDLLTIQIFDRAGAGEPESVEVIQVLKISVNFRSRHHFTTGSY
jgi:hypothetical protein